MFPGLTDSSKGQPDVACGSESREREKDDNETDSEGRGMYCKERKGGGYSRRGKLQVTGNVKKQSNIQGFSAVLSF